MNTRSVVTGIFVGVMVMNFLMPTVLSRSSEYNIFLLLYALPITGALTSVAIEIEKRNERENENKKDIKETALLEENRSDAMKRLIGKYVTITTYGGALISGMLQGVEDNLILLTSAKRLDTPESITASILFIDKKDVREMKLSQANFEQKSENII